MRQCYKRAAAVMLVAGLIGKANAQLNYGSSSGTTGTDRVFVGVSAGQMNTGSGNTFVGKSAGQMNTTGGSNTFLGYKSGFGNNAGSFNVYIGSEVARVYGGSQNVFIGNNSGEEFKGSHNVLIGDGAGTKGSGANNVVMGAGAGNEISGNNNVFLGGGVASWNVGTATGNVFAGVGSGAGTKNSKENSFFGYNSGEHNETGNFNCYFGSYSGGNVMNGQYNSYYGYSTGLNNAGGKYNTFLGAYADGTPNIAGATSIGYGALVTQSNTIVLGRDIDRVGIGVSAPSYQLQLNSDMAAKPGNSAWKVFSDRRLKKDISDYTDGLSLLKQIKPVWFAYNGEAGVKTTRKFVGIIAQDMQKIAPYTIGTFTYKDSSGKQTEYLDYDASAITYMLINSVKEQQEIIDQKEEKIQSLSERLLQSEKIQGEMIARLEKLEKLEAASGPNLNSKDDNVAARIEQNSPNGFSGNTSIKYFIPQDVKTAVINIYSVDGIKAGSYTIQERGQGELNLSATEFKSGVHIYDLVTDGKSSGTKKMLVK